MTPTITDTNQLVDLLMRAVQRCAEIAQHVTSGPWWYDQSDLVWRLHGVETRIPAVMLGEQIVNRQILKAPKAHTPYQEYWPSLADGDHITTWHPGTTRHAASMLANVAGWLLSQPDQPLPAFMLAECEAMARSILGEQPFDEELRADTPHVA